MPWAHVDFLIPRLLLQEITMLKLKNAPSKTGNPSGGGRGNNPPQK